MTEYPLPWRWEEAWIGTRIVAANHRPVVMITKRTAGRRIDEERALAKQIVAAVNGAVKAT